MEYEIISGTIKPGEVLYLDHECQLEASNYIEVKDGDNGIILCVRAETDSSIEILPGDSVFSGGSKKIQVYYEGVNYIYLESGRYVIHNSDGTNIIRVLCEDEGIHCSVIQLV